jgi:alpha-tubulin suppressor-like RCC1 family protein
LRDSARIPPKVPTGLSQVSGGYDGACVVTLTAQLWCWGTNKWGNLGNGATGGTDPYPGRASMAVPIEQVSTGGQTTCALTPDGPGPGAAAWCWGANEYGQVGDGTTVSPRPTPAPVQSLGRVTQVAAGQTASCAIILAGIVKCWGWNKAGELGDNSTNESSKPVSVSGLTGVVQLALGASFACALTDAGSVYCWGWNTVGELGDGSTKTSHVPVAVSGIGGANPAVAIAAGNVSACAVLLGGQVRCWGDNSAGELGDPSAGVQSSIPVPVSGFSSDGQISANPNGVAVCALNTNQQASCWGDNYFDELGDGANGGQRDTPGLVKGL